MKTFVDTVKAYSQWKLKECGNSKISKREIREIRENYNKEVTALRENGGKKEMPKQLKEACGSFLSWKKSNGKEQKISKEEFAHIKESVAEKNKKDFNTYVNNYKAFKEAANQGNKLSNSELKMLKENFRTAIENGIKLEECNESFDVRKALREADMGMDPAAGGAPMAGDPNAMAAPGADPMAAGTPADPMALQGAVDAALAALQPVATGGGNALGADPNAGIPPVDGSGAAAAGPAPGAAPGLMEDAQNFLNWKKANGKGDKLTEAEIKILKEKHNVTGEKSEYQKIKERIAEREAKIVALQEGAVQDSQKKIDAGKGYPEPVSNSHGGDHSVSAEQVVVPAAGKLANGYSSGAAAGETSPAKTWPTKAIGKEAGGALQGSGATQSKVKESEEGCPKCGADPCTCEGEQLDESKNLTVTDIYVQRAMEPKLDFQAIRESMKKGLLG
jgi:predicted peroxiredoxin